LNFEQYLRQTGHVLGLVSLYGQCSSACSSGDYVYRCPLAQAAYKEIFPGQTLRVENDGGGGTACAHWEEDDFPKATTGASELMTGYFESNMLQPITKVSIAALDETYTDYVVDYTQADSYPSAITNNIVGSYQNESGWKVLRPTTSFTLEGRMIRITPIPIPM